MTKKMELPNDVLKDIEELALAWGFTTEENKKIGHYRTAIVRECLQKVKEMEKKAFNDLTLNKN